MVLWEIALGTAYFLGIKRSHKLALRLQRKLISPNYPKIREFAQRRTRTVFDAALKAHLKAQEMKTAILQSFDNRILGWFDKAKQTAAIQGPPRGGNVNSTSIRQQINAEANLRRLQILRGKSEQMFAAARNISLGERRTRYVSDAALRVHMKAQQMGSGIRQTVNNRILGWLGRKKLTDHIQGPPAALGSGNVDLTSIRKKLTDHIQGPPAALGSGNVDLTSIRKQISIAANQPHLQNLRGSSEHLFTAARNILPTTINMMRPLRPAGSNIQYRQFTAGGDELSNAKKWVIWRWRRG